MKRDGLKRNDLLTESYNFELPERLIAQRPAPNRDHSKLLVYKQKLDSVEHRKFHELADILEPETLLVLNQSKVFPCRLLGKKSTGGKAEMEYLSQKAFLGEEEEKKDLRSSYFDRQTLAEEAAQETLPETVIDLDQVYFSDSVSTKAAGAQKEKGPNK